MWEVATKSVRFDQAARNPNLRREQLASIKKAEIHRHKNVKLFEKTCCTPLPCCLCLEATRRPRKGTCRCLCGGQKNNERRYLPFAAHTNSRYSARFQQSPTSPGLGQVLLARVGSGWVGCLHQWNPRRKKSEMLASRESWIDFWTASRRQEGYHSTPQHRPIY